MFIAALAATFATDTVVAEEKTRFESNGFLQSLDMFISEQTALSRRDLKAAGKNPNDDLKLSLRKKALDASEIESGFFYLRSARQAQSTGSTLSTPDFSSLLSRDGTTRGPKGDILGTGTRLGVRFGGEPDSENIADRGFEVAIETAYRLTQDNISTFLPPVSHLNSDLASRQINLGLSLGYSRFIFDASLMQETSAFAENSHSYDVGFSYRSNSWAARLSMSEYKKGKDLLGIENESRNIISVELGASYKLSNRFGLKGGLRYYDYRDRLLVNTADGENAQLIFLGGQVKF